MRKLRLEELDVETFTVVAETGAEAGTVEGRGVERPGTLTYEGGYTCNPDSGCPNGCTSMDER